MTDDYKQLGKHIAAGAGFVSNFIFWRESGYFDNATDTKPLLHLWSLGIEEQFYLVWPLLLWYGWKQRLNLLTISIVIALTSFTLNINKVHTNTIAAFYSPQTRFWELLVGSVLAYMAMYKQNYFATTRQKFDTWLDIHLAPIIYAQTPEKNGGTRRNLQSLIGGVIIVVAIIIINKNVFFPGWWAVLPTLGAVLIISAGSDAWLNRTVLSSRLLVWFGLISFPLYLWHWPLLIFARIFKGEELPKGLRIAIVAISIVLAWLTYRLIEKPIRFGQHSQIKTVTLFILMIGVGLAGFHCYKRNGLAFRLKDREEFAAYFENSLPERKYFKKFLFNDVPNEKWRIECNFYDIFAEIYGNQTFTPLPKIGSNCVERKSSYSHALFIWGDSHAMQLYLGLRNNLPSDWQILQVTSFGCPPGDVKQKYKYCQHSNEMALKAIAETKPDVVLIAHMNEHSIDKFNQITEKLKSLGIKKVIFMGPTPFWTMDLHKIILTKLWINTPRRTYEGINKTILAENSLLQEKFVKNDTSIYVSLIDFLCNKDGCLTYVGSDKKTGLTFFDGQHLTPAASDYVAKNLLVKKIVGDSNATQ